MSINSTGVARELHTTNGKAIRLCNILNYPLIKSGKIMAYLSIFYSRNDITYSKLLHKASKCMISKYGLIGIL